VNSLAVQTAHRRLIEALKRDGFIATSDDDSDTLSAQATTDIRGYVEVVGERDKRLVYRHAGDTLDLSGLTPDEAVERIRLTMLQPA
jgi:hypothetical protein